jgi:hypothetical protein
LAYILIVIVLAAVSAFIFVRFPIRRKDHEARLIRLAESRRSGEA